MDANSYLVTELIDAGLNRREARWLVDEFSPPNHGSIAAMPAAAQRRLNGEPIQYVLGHWPFRSLDLDLNARVQVEIERTERPMAEHVLNRFAVKSSLGGGGHRGDRLVIRGREQIGRASCRGRG